MSAQVRKVCIIVFSLLAIASTVLVFDLKFSFSLEQFFPEGDEDLAFYQSFIEEFETDINFLLVAIERKEGVFDQEFLKQVDDFSLAVKDIPFVDKSESLTQLSYPLKTPFGITTIPAIHIDEPAKYEKDKFRILNDDRLVYNLISKDGTSLTVALKTTGNLSLEESQELIPLLENLLDSYHFDEYHLLGPAYFQNEMVAMQKREVTVSAIISAILVSIIMFLIFRKPVGISIALFSIGLGLLLFMGLLAAWGRPLNAMAALYPVLMIIVGTSDVIHIMSKYIDELNKGENRFNAIRTTIREIGMATLLTSITTAIGFAALITSKVGPIRAFGLNSAIGVIVAYVTVIFFTTALLSMFRADQIIKLKEKGSFWERLMDRSYHFTKRNQKGIAFGALLTLLICAWGISLITTNYRLESNLPRGKKISADFMFFEKEFSGFRPLEFAVFAQDDYKANQYKVLKEIDKVEQHLYSLPQIRTVNSLTSVYKSINQMHKRNRQEAYQMPDNERTFNKYQKLVSKVPASNLNILISKDEKKARISAKALDLGADSLQTLGHQIDQWILSNTDTTVVKFRRTGTGMILDKNTEYIRANLLEGLGIAMLIVSLLMALLFRNIRMFIISFVPNLFPLLTAGALLGFLGIELEAGIAIVFAIVFGIAVDDTIHFLSKFKLARNKGMDIESALHVTFLETGKAICLTTLVLFFGFLVMLFSIHPPSVTIGLLISLTLISALLADLMIIPLLIRWFYREENKRSVIVNQKTKLNPVAKD